MAVCRLSGLGFWPKPPIKLLNASSGLIPPPPSSIAINCANSADTGTMEPSGFATGFNKGKSEILDRSVGCTKALLPKPAKVADSPTAVLPKVTGAALATWAAMPMALDAPLKSAAATAPKRPAPEYAGDNPEKPPPDWLDECNWLFAALPGKPELALKPSNSDVFRVDCRNCIFKAEGSASCCSARSTAKSSAVLLMF